MSKDRKPLDPIVKLRVGIARTAMQLGLDTRIPGYVGGELSFERLTHFAQTEERGWNALLAAMGTAIEDRERDRAFIQAQMESEALHPLRRS